MDPLVKYQDDFKEIVELVWQIHNSPSSMISSKPTDRSHHKDPDQIQYSYTQIPGQYSSHLSFSFSKNGDGRRELMRIRSTYWTTFTVDKEDVQQELTYMWLKYWKILQKREKGKKYVHPRDYLLSCTVWGMKTWYYSEVIAASHGQEYARSEWEDQSDPPPFSLTMRFVTLGTDLKPLDTLDPYERYLIFLMYKMRKNTVEIAHIAQRDRKAITEQLRQIHSRLRSLADETQDPR